MSLQHVRPAVGPSPLWYWVAGAAVAASVLWLTVGLFLELLTLTRDVQQFQRVPIPGQAEVSFTAPGSYTLYFEAPGPAEDLTGGSFNVSLRSVNASGGKAVPIRPNDGVETYNIAGHSGRAVATFRIDTPGRFLLSADNLQPQVDQANVAVGRGTDESPVLLRTTPAVLVVSLGGVVLAAVVAVRRNRPRRRLPEQAIPWGTWGSGAVPAGWVADPSRRYELRYWDGHKWTEHVLDRGTRALDPTGADDARGQV
jgi:hypothetical protein